MPETSRHLEVERKFDVLDSTVTPSFEGIATVARVEKLPTQSLDAMYFDTQTQDLARNKITLRRRTGGHDAGWHLKLPAGPDARTEIRMPLGSADDDTVPGELLDVVLAIVRDRPLRPVARITTQRESQVLYSNEGAPFAEFSNDHVRAWSANATDSPDAEPVVQEWREWELELDESRGATDTELLSRLSNRLLDAGGEPANHASKLARVLGTPVPTNGSEPPEDPVRRAIAEQIDELVVWDRAVRADVFDSVHQMRVTTRKIRSLLKDAQAGLSDDTHAWVLDELRELAGILGVARDAEVLAQRYEQELDRLSPELVRGPVRERLVEGAKRRYQSGLRRSLIAMRSQRYFRLLDALDSIVAQRPTTATGEQPAPVTIDAAYKKVRKAAKAAAEADQAAQAHEEQVAAGADEDHDDDEEHDRDEALHVIRKRAKRLRYTAAATGAEDVSKQAKAIQTLLGDHQDSVVSRDHLLQQADAAHAAGEDTFTYGLLYQQESDLAESCRQQLDEALRKLDKSVKKAR
ncbi:adenylate cyclase, putative [Mycobacterium lentiflavum]|uniref:Adenylate cyclase, putative n=1 Tax=Mycobacterium lentiflavum TaxID=141349 RepID=A0A0E3WCT8_MYCLN|nr:CYTH and CHAD domain-containing protein [Mycobacterium lentiflavum]MEE3065767.1 CYTH and CHAD domain-containing protein [Actinomycetota bacterium]ULP40608.1 CYTH and CHAD domain-containing protein [Mycobacterium lentiflavum]CQD16287.1 adenylate cyclase, putative [Mycobacterium lentiflavum]